MAGVVGRFLCFLIVMIDVAAGIFGIWANVAQDKEKHSNLSTSECGGPSHQAFMIGLIAAILLGLAHVLGHLLSCGSCLRSGSGKCSLTCFILTWIELTVGVTTLTIGAMSNKKARESCGFLQSHLLSIGGISCFLHAYFSTAFYVSATAPLINE